MPEEQQAAVYGSGDGSLDHRQLPAEKTAGKSRAEWPFFQHLHDPQRDYVFAASQASHVLTVVNQSNGSSYPLSLPGVYRVSVNPGGTMALAFVQNSNYAYYPRH